MRGKVLYLMEKWKILLIVYKYANVKRYYIYIHIYENVLR